ncbi:TetR/AcrR family transcriptional regulator [Dactylosporangium sp. CA-233914]|uniref:TetR/AcrR family transcriptional regulator n=1 Tax=Dactylosporangium sp. CA-233914 TaxID=3239934 RepID=UPI003D8C4189
MSDQGRSRRAPAGDERRRDADRSRESLLDAALVEFGEHGYAGARISAIARRAGVNQQLISYYFGGKEGLYRALTARWREMSGGLNRAEAPLSEVVAAFTHVGAAQRHWVRLLLWQALEGDGEEEGSAEYRRAMVEDLRHRQSAGELAADLDPAFLQLALFGAAIAPTLLSGFAEDFTGLPAASPEFVERYREQLRRIVAHLAAELP